MPALTSPVVAAGSLRDAAQPVLHAGDLVLRPFADSDAPVLLAAYADPAIQLWHGRRLESEAEALEMVDGYRRAWRAETGAYWAICAADTVLGRVALRTVDLGEGVAEIGYWALPAARGRGAVVRATGELGRWAFDDLGLHRLELQHAVANTASCRVATKAGFAAEGTSRSGGLHLDGWHDMHRHARIRGDA